MVTVIKNWKMVESSVEEGPNVPENAWKMVGPQYRLTLRGLSSAALTRTGKLLSLPPATAEAAARNWQKVAEPHVAVAIQW